MKITARVDNSKGQHHVTLTTNDNSHSIVIPPKPTGFGSSANGGELLFLALATCYCNDIHREAAKRNIKVEKVEVEVSGDFGAEGDGAKNVAYHVKIHAQGTKEEIHELVEHTDKVAEIQNTLRVETPVVLAIREIHCTKRQYKFQLPWHLK
jgi:organic hydroperoxide reductase OsmC/OhrA